MGFSEKILNLKTLIVEDNDSFRGVLRDELKTLFPSMVIQEAVEGNETLQKVDAFQPDLIFMDIQLPGENGLQLTKKIRNKYPNTRIIILTGYDSMEYREAAIRSGGNCYILKDSLNYVQLENLVKTILE